MPKTAISAEKANTETTELMIEKASFRCQDLLSLSSPTTRKTLKTVMARMSDNISLSSSSSCNFSRSYTRAECWQ